MSTDTLQTTDIDPHDVDWRELFKKQAGSPSGRLGLLERVQAIKDHLGVANEDYAERVLGDALEAGILETDGDYVYIPGEGGVDDLDVGAEDVDWGSVFNGAAGSPQSKMSGTGAGAQVYAYSDGVGTVSEGDEIWEEAKELGIVEFRDESAPEGRGFYLADEYRPEGSSDEEEELELEELDEETKLHEGVEALRSEAGTQEEYIKSMEKAFSDVLTRLEKVENRQDRIFDEHRQQRTGITEIQVERLKNGHRLSRDGVDEDMLEELGLDIIVVGDNRDVIRVADRHVCDNNEDVSSRQMPDFESLCELEAARLKNVLGIMSRDEIEGESKQKYRAMTIWEDAELLDVTDRKDSIGIPSWKVGEKLESVKENVYDEDKRRVMSTVVELSDGVFTLEEGSTNKLVADKEDLADAKQPRFEKSTIQSTDGSDNTVVSSREGVSVSGTGR